ncbi:MAG: GDSL-type esterase/lipase family protein [Lachnospiraceae bacterium]|nr:GDSL-type esterase/lipase family protein [Lachnospiraceae bacterium]
MREMICMGDSLVYGHIVDRDKCWVSLLSDRTGIKTYNYGMNGETTPDLLKRFDRQVPGNTKAGELFLLAGINDFIFLKCRVYDTVNNLLYMVRKAQAQGLKVYLSTITPMIPDMLPDMWREPVEKNDVLKKREELNLWIRQQKECVDMEKAVLGSDGAPRRELYIEGLHLNEKGHRVFEEYLEGKVRQDGQP